MHSQPPICSPLNCLKWRRIIARGGNLTPRWLVGLPTFQHLLRPLSWRVILAPDVFLALQTIVSQLFTKPLGTLSFSLCLGMECDCVGLPSPQHEEKLRDREKV